MEGEEGLRDELSNATGRGSLHREECKWRGSWAGCTKMRCALVSRSVGCVDSSILPWSSGEHQSHLTAVLELACYRTALGRRRWW